MTDTPNPYPTLDDEHYHAIVNGTYTKSSYSNANGGCLSFTAVDGLIGLQDDKLSTPERHARTLVFNHTEIAAFIAGAKAGDFDHLLH